MSYTAEEVYRLLPDLYRVRDAEQGGILRELVELLTEQANVLSDSLDQLYEDQFIETCADWVAPYIGDLIGYRTLHGVAPKVASPRAEVANTIGYRRRKGTAAMLEQLARDVTGWPARAFEFFEQLATTQFMNHVRPHAQATASLRDAVALELPDAFNRFAHTADMRRSGKYNIPNVGIFLWRIPALRLTHVPLTTADGSGRHFRFDQLGADQPLFGAPRTETEISHIAEPQDVPLPLGRRWLAGALPDYYGTTVEIEGVPLADVRICDLTDWIHEPSAGVAIDPVLGRISFATAPDEPLATFHYGAALAAGGGGYDRDVEPGPGLIDDSRPHALPATVTEPIRAANRQRPLFTGSGTTLEPVVLEGLLIDAPLTFAADGALVLRHCTLRRPLTITHLLADVTLDHCLVTDVNAAGALKANDSVIDGTIAG